MSDTLPALTETPDYRNLLERISDTCSQGRARALRAVNVQLTATCWQVGRYIVEFEQAGKLRAEYGKALLTTLSRDLSLRHGRGFSRANVVYMRLFYQCYPDVAKSQTLSDQLSWLNAGFVGAGLKPAPTSPRRKNLRLRGYDYTQTGLYFVTVCALERICLFGEINDGVMHLNSHGVLVEQAWLDLPAHYPNVELDQFVVMPNHFHGILILTNGTDMNPDVGAGFKPAPKKCHGLPEIVRAFKSFSARRINELRQTPGVSVWQRNYYEHVIRDDADYQRIAEYVVNNPARWAEDSLHPEYEANRANIANVGAGLNTVGADVKEDVKAGVGAGLRPAPTADRREQSDE